MSQPHESGAPVSVRKVENNRDFKVFLEFPWTVYKGDPNWVPPLVSQRRHTLDKSKSPAWEYLVGDYFIAWRAERPVGTIAAFINKRHNEYWGENLGWFGFFECFNDPDAARALLATAAEHVRGMGAEAIRGPANFTLNDECALLIENFEPPLILMPYNHPYYQGLIENSGLGYDKVMDVVSVYTDPKYYTDDQGNFPEKLLRVVGKVKQRNKLSTRRANSTRLKDDLALLRQVYQKAWQKNWGFVPPTDREMDVLFQNLRQYYDTRLGRFGLVDGEIAGFMMGLPDMNQVLHRAYPRPGEPELWTLLKALWHWKFRPKINRQRILLFGVNPEYRTSGVDAAIMLDYLDDSHHSPFQRIDAGWVLETNLPALSLMKPFGAFIYKRYRFYQKALK